MLLAHGGIPCGLESPETYAYLGLLSYYFYPALASVRAFFAVRGR